MKRGLGKGIDVLFGDGDKATVTDDGAMRNVGISSLQPGKFQPRRSFPETSLDELAASIRERGVMQPIMVRPAGRNSYEIIAGERRWQAAQKAGLAQVPVRICDYSDEQAIYASLVENLQREDLNAVDLAKGVKRLVSEFGLSHADAAKGVGLARTTVTNLLRILALAPEILRLVENGSLEMGHARTLASLPASLQKIAARKVVSLRLSVRQTEDLVKRLSAKEPPKKGHPKRKSNPDVDELLERISAKLGTKVTLAGAGKTRGRLVIHYRNLDALDRIIGKLES